MTDVPQHELDFRVSHRGQGFEFARHGLPLTQLAPLIVRLGPEPRLTELEDWDHDCPHLDRLVLAHVLEEPECFRAAYGIGGNPTAHALLLTPGDAAAVMRAVASGMTCTLSDGSGPDAWEIRTHDNHFALVSGPDRQVLRDLVAQAIQSFVGQLVHEPAEIPAAVTDRIIEAFPDTPMVCVARPEEPRRGFLAWLRRRQADSRPAALWSQGSLIVPLSPSQSSWVRSDMAVTAAHTKQVLWLTYEPSLRRWNAVSTAPEASRDQEHQR